MPELNLQPARHEPAADDPVPAGGAGRWRWLAYALAMLLMGLVFALYVQPEMMVTLANQLWACF